MNINYSVLNTTVMSQFIVTFANSTWRLYKKYNVLYYFGNNNNNKHNNKTILRYIQTMMRSVTLLITHELHNEM